MVVFLFPLAIVIAMKSSLTDYYFYPELSECTRGQYMVFLAVHYSVLLFTIVWSVFDYANKI